MACWSNHGPMSSQDRRHTPGLTELRVLDRSRRRCALCFHIDGDLTEKHGQIAHVDKNPANFAEDNLAWLCLPHHSLFDSKTSQHKNYTLAEVKRARDTLYQEIEQGRHSAAPTIVMQGRNADRGTLDDIIKRLSGTIRRLRDWSFNGTSFPLEWFDPVWSFLQERRGPEFEFVDVQLEADRRAMFDRLSRLSRLIESIARSVPGQSGWHRIPIEWVDTKPAHYNKMAARFDTTLRRVCQTYDNLIRAARRKLDP
jgi:hypothetical protein